MQLRKSLMLILLAVFSTVAAAQESAPTTSGVHEKLVVTVEHHHGSQVPMIDAKDVMVYLKHQKVDVTDWLPLRGSNSGVELFLLIDDSSNTSLGSQLDDLRQFILSQPSSTAIGVAYMQNGTAAVLQNLTTDHSLAAKVLRLPLGNAGASASPYFSLGD